MGRYALRGMLPVRSALSHWENMSKRSGCRILRRILRDLCMTVETPGFGLSARECRRMDRSPVWLMTACRSAGTIPSTDTCRSGYGTPCGYLDPLGPADGVSGCSRLSHGRPCICPIASGLRRLETGVPGTARSVCLFSVRGSLSRVRRPQTPCRLHIVPSLTISRKFFSGSVSSSIFSSGLPSTSNRSAKASVSIVPSGPG